MSDSIKILNQVFRSTINSYTMVFFSKNRWFGLILVLVSFFDIYAGIAGMISIFTANSFAWLMGLNRANILSGFYGFNALLVGLGLGIAFEPVPQFYLLLISVALATLFLTLAFEGFAGKYGLPYLTLPFLIALWIAALAARNYTTLMQGDSGIYTMNSIYESGGTAVVGIYEWFGDIHWPVAVKTYFKSLGAIFFQYHLFAGLLIAAGLLIYSRIAFLLSVLGFVSAWLFYMLIGADMNDLNYGYIGFNHILTAIAIGGFFMVASRWSMLWVILLTPIISIITSGFSELISSLQLPVYSLPFNVVVLLFLYSMKFRERMLLKPETVAVQYFSPEKNLYIGENSRNRFKNKAYVPVTLPFFGIWTVNQGHNGEYTHKADWKHAWDFVITGEDGKEFSGGGKDASDFHCFNKPVIAPADGWIEEIIDHIEDNAIGDTNIQHNWGNTIVIRHNEWLYTKLSHLKRGSIKVSQGAWVSRGQILAACGNSGNSPYPHLHFQIQATPHIGSATINYPVSQFICHSAKQELKIYEIPENGAKVSNVETEQSLKDAFHFVPGQTIRYSNEDAPGHIGEWKVIVDIYKNHYLFDDETGAKAYFFTDGALIFFTHYEGPQSSMLYYFYLAAYKIPLSSYRNLQVKDIFPPSSFASSPLLFFQDIVAPFYIFLKPEFSLTLHEIEEDLNGNRVVLASEVNLKIAGYNRMSYRFTISSNGGKLERMSISAGKVNTVISFLRS